MKRLFTLVLAGVTLMVSVGCGTHYLKPGITRQDYDRDFQNCYDQAVDAGPSIPVRVLAGLFFTPAAVVIADKRDDRIHSCMQSRGYTLGDSGYKGL